MNLSKILLLSCIFVGLHSMDNFQTDFDNVWPFEKLGTKYDDAFSVLAPILHRCFNEGYPDLLPDIYKYVEKPKDKSFLSPDLKNVFNSFITNEKQKKQILKIIKYVFIANNACKLSCAGNKVIIAFHGLGDTGYNFEQYIKHLDSNAASFVPDFYDHHDKALNIGTELELVMAAYQYFIATQQLKRLDPSNKMDVYLLGGSRGGGIVARLMSKFKKDQKPADGFIMLCPFINPPATVSHVAEVSSVQSSGFGIRFPQWLMSSSIKSANSISADRIELNTEIPAVVKLNKPILIVHGSKDRIIPHEESENWALEHAKLGNEVYYLKVPGVDHNELFGELSCIELIRAFLNKDFAKLKPLRIQ
ncbi:alpha/beta hydrolase [Candidatus Dependentiae bacterium]|nr:alpha/beta hydrolase [Candidatus Dependentiae bacterium]